MARKPDILASKKPMTVAELASLGGKARAAALTPERRREIAVAAIKARWAKHGKRKVEGHTGV